MPQNLLPLLVAFRSSVLIFVFNEENPNKYYDDDRGDANTDANSYSDHRCRTYCMLNSITNDQIKRRVKKHLTSIFSFSFLQLYFPVPSFFSFDWSFLFFTLSFFYLISFILHFLFIFPLLLIIYSIFLSICLPFFDHSFFCFFVHPS